MKMRHILMCLTLSIFWSSLGWTQSLTPFLIPLDPSPATLEEQQPNLNHQFKEMRRSLEMAEAEEAQGHSKHVTLRRFTNESVAFFLAIAAVQIEALIVDYSNNPSALQAHLESLKDPIGHLSFYLFMVANGYTTDFLRKGVTTVDPLAKAQAFRRISYLGMSAGSIASSLSADILTTMKECAKVVFATGKKQKEERLSVCDVALEQWTLNAKAQQYIPQIISLLVSTEVAQVAEMRGKKVVSWFTKKELAKRFATKSGNALRVIGVDVLALASPAGLTVKGLRFAGKAVQFAGFTYIDHQISPFIFKGFANVWQPASFDFDASSFNSSVVEAKKSGWENEQANLDLSKNLLDIKKAMTNWRQTQLTQFYTSHSIWGENLAKIIDQTQTTFSFYKKYIENLYESLNTQFQIQTGKLPETALREISYYPFRALPLYGIRLLKDLPDDYESAEDLYLTNLSELEKYQRSTLREAAQILKNEFSQKKLIKTDTELVNEIIQAFESQDLRAIGRAIEKINDTVLYNRGVVGDYSLRNSLIKIRKFLGDPRPISVSGMGFSYAFEMNSFNQLAMKTLKKTSGPGQSLSRSSDYLTLQMVCGAEDTVYENPWGFSPSFNPPKIVASRIDIAALCRSQFLSNIYDMNLTSADGRRYAGITEVISKNIKPEILGDVRDKTQSHAFDGWWSTNVNAQLLNLYKIFDGEYINVLEKLTQNWQGLNVGTHCKTLSIGKCLGGAVNSALDHLNASDYLDKNVLKNLEFEMNIYTTVLNEVLSDNSTNQKLTQAIAKDHGGLLRRIKGGDFSIIAGKRVAELSEISRLKAAVRNRLTTLSQMSVKNGVVYNFPTKESTKEALDELSESLKSLSELINHLPASRKPVVGSAVAGIESVISEVSSLNMAFYTTKYRLEDSYEDLLPIANKDKKEKRTNAPRAFGQALGQ
ncbi:MAG: hypothetical protein IPM97_04210 [Bdellovibrionaceae bacterium]|nr:hypothetical protein [Pseudobdellovibrionaceae bacterium]